MNLCERFKVMVHHILSGILQRCPVNIREVQFDWTADFKKFQGDRNTDATTTGAGIQQSDRFGFLTVFYLELSLISYRLES